MDDAPQPAQLERFIAHLYRSGLAVPPAQYRSWALEQLRRLIPFDAALWGSGSGQKGGFHTVALIDLPPEFPMALEQTREFNPLLPQLARRFDQPMCMEEVCDDGSFYASEFYRRCFQPFGIERVLSTAHADPRTGLYSLLSLYRRRRDVRFTAEERRLQGRLVFHLFEAASHSFFLHLWRTHSERPANSAAAVIDRRGYFYEAQPRFLDLLEAHFPERRERALPFPCPTPGKLEHIAGLCIQAEALGDLMCIYAWPEGPLDRLTAREREIVLAVTQGLSFKEAARNIGVAPSTVANHLYRIYRKLGVSSRSQLAGLVYPNATRGA